MRAVKGNKEYTIDEVQKKFYQDSGFDILDDDGTVTAYGRGKTVPYEDHIKAVREIERLQSLTGKLRTENETLKDASAKMKKDVPEVTPTEKEKIGGKVTDKKAGE